MEGHITKMPDSCQILSSRHLAFYKNASIFITKADIPSNCSRKCWNFVDDPSLHENDVVICHLKSCQLSQCSMTWLRYTWNSAAADVVCRQLGFRKSLKSLHGLDSRVRVPRGLVTITDSVTCSGDESSLSQCSVSYSSSCPMDRVVYVRKGWILVSVNQWYYCQQCVDKSQGFIQ